MVKKGGGAFDTANKVLDSAAKVMVAEQKADPLLGEAHKLWDAFTALEAAKGKGDKKGGKTTISKPKLKEMVMHLNKLQRMQFVSMARLDEFVDREFKKSDRDGNAKLEFNEFFDFYRKWLNCDSKQVLARLSSTMDEVERCFLEADVNGDMSLDREELLQLLKRRTPPGQPPPADDELRKVVDWLFEEFDANGDGVFQYEEFVEGFNAMCEKLSVLHDGALKKLSTKSWFKKVVNDDDLDDDDLEALEQAVMRRYEVDPWVVRVGEVMPCRGDGGKNVLDMAKAVRKIPLLLKHPDQPLDNISQHYSGRSNVTMVDVQQLIVERKLEGVAFATAIRDALVECWQDGRLCVMRLGQTAPDFCLQYNLADVLPVDVFDAQLLTPGQPLHPSLHCMLRDSAHAATAATFQIANGFALVFVSAFSMHTFRESLRGKLPLGYVQPVQVT